MQQKIRSICGIRIDCLDDNTLRIFAPGHCEIVDFKFYEDFLGKDNLPSYHSDINRILLVPAHFANFYFKFVEHFKKDRMHECDYFRSKRVFATHSTFLSTFINTLRNYFPHAQSNASSGRETTSSSVSGPFNLDEHLRIRYFATNPSNCIGKLFQLDSEGCIKTLREDFENSLSKKPVNVVVHRKDANIYVPPSYLIGCLKGLFVIKIQFYALH